MRSEHGEAFNHDPWVQDYDADVRNESDPIRTGYAAVLEWVASESEIAPSHRVLELGSGTGNLSVLLPDCHQLVCLDISCKMEEVASMKQTRAAKREFHAIDVLEFFDQNRESFDRVVSTYTLHHLTESEKSHMLRILWDRLPESGVAVIGDLMVRDEAEFQTLRDRYAERAFAEVVEALDEEFFWRLNPQCEVAKNLGFEVSTRQFSNFSFGLKLRKPQS